MIIKIEDMQFHYFYTVVIFFSISITIFSATDYIANCSTYPVNIRLDGDTLPQIYMQCHGNYHMIEH